MRRILWLAVASPTAWRSAGGARAKAERRPCCLRSAVIPFAADALMILPQLAAVYYAAAGRAFWAGIYSGIAFLVNAKGLFVLAICGVWLWAELPVLILGFVLPVAAGAIWAVATGALAGYWEQVWRWGWL